MEKLIVFYPIPEKENSIKRNSNVISKLIDHIQEYTKLKSLLNTFI